jgi:general secretion pathway protein A
MQIIRSHNKRPLLIIDEAQNLSPDALEEVRLLSNIQDNDTMLLQIMLVGQPELRAKLKNKAAASFAQRVAVSYHLVPLTLEETRQYIVHRLENAGGRADLFTESAINLVYETTMGVPRAINLLSHNALVYGFADDINTIDAGVVEQVIAEKTGIGFGAGSFDRKESERDTHSDLTDLEKKHHQIEDKIKALEKHVEDYTRKLKTIFKTLLIEERKKNDKLLKDYVRLQTGYDALKKDNPIKHKQRRSGIKVNLIDH